MRLNGGMKMLLTSDGITSDAIRQKLLDLVGSEPSVHTIAFIPTARNYEGANREKVDRTLDTLNSMGFSVKLIDIEKDANWEEQISGCTVIFVGGGNTYYLMDQINKSGFGASLPKLLEGRVYVGDSAGSIVVTPSTDIAAVDDGDENIVQLSDTSGLGLVDFEVSPHTPEDVSISGNEEYAKTISHKLIAYDNGSAVVVDGDEVEVIGGEWVEFNGD